MDMNEFYKFLNESTYINNVNTGQAMVPGYGRTSWD